jgi:hypothetical protein
MFLRRADALRLKPAFPNSRLSSKNRDKEFVKKKVSRFFFGKKGKAKPSKKVGSGGFEGAELSQNRKYGFLPKKEKKKLDNLPKEKRRKIVKKYLATDPAELSLLDRPPEPIFEEKDYRFYNSDYLFKLSHLVRVKILHLDQQAEKPKELLILRGKLMKLNYKINKQIRDTCLKQLGRGVGTINLEEMTEAA